MNSRPTGRSIGGWLYVIGVLLIVACWRMLVNLKSYQTFLASDSWFSFALPGSFGTSPAWVGFVIVEMFVASIFFVGFVFALYLFVTRSRAFPDVYIMLLQGIALFVALDIVLVWLLSPENRVHRESLIELERALLVLSLWWPYLRFSTRVRETFVH